MQKIILGIVVASLGAGCGTVNATIAPPEAQPAVVGGGPTSPYAQVAVGPVHAFVPTGWQTVPVGSPDNIRGGFIASPEPDAWRHMDGSITGMTASWVDATRVGVPSDFYYLAARDLLLSRLRAGAGCRVLSQRVFSDNLPTLAHGRLSSPGDYVARGEGTCRVGAGPTRWAYFIAAPGFGPVRRMGIPNSGLYVVVAIVQNSARAGVQLRKLIAGTSFGGAAVADLVAAVSH